MRQAAQTLTLGAHTVGKDLAQVDPDDGALGKREERDEAHQQPHQNALVLGAGEDVGDSAQAGRRAH